MIQGTPKQYDEYTQKVFEWVKKNKVLTHKDIAKITGCNCSYSVIRCLKKKCKLIETWQNEPKRFKVYMFDGIIENEKK